MSFWQEAAWLLALALGACAVPAARGAPWRRLLALQLAGTVLCLEWLCLAVATGADYLLTTALVLGFASAVGTVAWARFLERGR